MTGKTVPADGRGFVRRRAAMEPGRDDREDGHQACPGPAIIAQPLWSPVAMTGKTSSIRLPDFAKLSCRYGARSR